MDGSLRRLKSDYIDLLYQHRVDPEVEGWVNPRFIAKGLGLTGSADPRPILRRLPADGKMPATLPTNANRMAGEPVTVRQQGPVTLTSGADAMFPSGGWELKPGVPVLTKVLPTLSKLQHTEIVVGGYTDNTPIGQQLQSAGIANNLDLSCKRAASVVSYLASQGVNPNLLSAQCFGATHPVGPNDTPEGQAKNRRVDITLTGDGT